MLKSEKLQSAVHTETLDGGMVGSADPMTMSGAINKTFIMASLLLVAALYGFANPSNLFLFGGAIGGIALVFAMSFKPSLSPTLAPIYALLKGLFLGSVTVYYAASFGVGIVFQAILLTISLLFMMLFIYKAGIIKVTEKFRSMVIMAMGAIFVVYLLNFALSFFGTALPYLHQGGVIGIGISLVVIVVASLMLLVDFDQFDRAVAARAPKYMEWFCAMGLIVTLIWLYLEILRLLSVIAGND